MQSSGGISCLGLKAYFLFDQSFRCHCFFISVVIMRKFWYSCADAVWVAQQRDRQMASPATSPQPLILYCGAAPWHFRYVCNSNTKFLLDWTSVNAKDRRNWEMSYFYCVAFCKYSLRSGKQNCLGGVSLCIKVILWQIGWTTRLFGEVCVNEN